MRNQAQTVGVRDHGPSAIGLASPSFFFQNSYFSNKQYGFVKGRSTVLQLLKIMDDWTAQLDSGGQVDIVYTDFAEAFDIVPHQRLLLKIRTYILI